MRSIAQPFNKIRIRIATAFCPFYTSSILHHLAKPQRAHSDHLLDFEFEAQDIFTGLQILLRGFIV